MDFPRLPRELDRRFKLSLEDVENIKQEKFRGLSQRKVGTMYGISKTMVAYYWMSDAQRREKNKKRQEAIKRQIETEPGFYEKRIKQNTLSAIRGYQVLKERAIYKCKNTYKWKKKKYHTNEEFRKKTIEQTMKNYYKSKSL